MHWYKRVALDSPDGDYSCKNGWVARGHFGIENKALGFKMERHIDVVVRGTRIYLKKLYPDKYPLDYYDR
jgi:hypothetical protein